MAVKKEKRERHWLLRAVVGIAMFVWFLITIPYHLVKGVIWLVKRFEKEQQEEEVEEKREARGARYEQFEIIESEQGSFTNWEKKFMSKNTIGIILGSRGAGKTAIGVKLMENLYAKTHKKCFAMGFKAEDLPSWITAVEYVPQIQNDAIVLVDEGGILFSSRKSMSAANKLLSELILVSRHKNLTILFISQNSSNLDVNIIRQADFLVLKPSSLLQKDFERKNIQKLYVDLEEKFTDYKGKRGITYLYSDDFRGFVTNALPSFWSKNLSTSFR